MNQQTTTTPSSVGLRYGLITGFVSVIYTLILYVTELNENMWLSNLSILIMIVGIVMAHKNFKGENGGFMSYGQGLGIGSIVSAVVGLLSSVFVFVYVQFIDTGFLAKVREAQIVKMEEQGMSDEQIDQAMAMAEKFSSPAMMLIMGFIVTFIIGFLISLVVAAIMKKSQPEFE